VSGAQSNSIGGVLQVTALDAKVIRLEERPDAIERNAPALSPGRKTRGFPQRKAGSRSQSAPHYRAQALRDTEMPRASSHVIRSRDRS
jgi:hypothetical protein